MENLTSQVRDNRLILARKHVMAHECEMRSSAELCLSDALLDMETGDYDSARRNALKSLSYSVGKFHPDYKRSAK